jgi:hypothetical protein
MGLISRSIGGSCFRDLISVYGYPDLDQSDPCPAQAHTDSILREMQQAAVSSGHIAAYIRLGLSQQILNFDNRSFAQQAHVGDVVVVGLERQFSEIFGSFRKNLRNELRKVTNLKFEVSDDSDAFHVIYEENMTRIKAHDEYFFSAEYLRALCAMPGVELILAFDERGPVGGVLLVSHGDLLFYHLGATADRGLQLSPLKHILRRVIEMNSQSCYRGFVLGGGVGGRNDSLLKFKLGFSKEMTPVYALKVIFDKAAYAALTNGRVRADAMDSFFPGYRDPKLLDSPRVPQN